MGQFGDVHIGTCRMKQKERTMSQGGCRLTLPKEGSSPEAGGNSEGGSKTGTINVAVKTCKADADLETSEKFLEEACKCSYGAEFKCTV